jgi:ferrous iron transport protein A
MRAHFPKKSIGRSLNFRYYCESLSFTLHDGLVMEHSAVLSYLTPGERVVIQDIEAEETVRQRLQAMGLLNGREVQMIRRARFGGPLQIRIGSVNLIMRRSDAARVKVTRLS